MSTTIRPFARGDFDAWNTLWQANVDAQVTDAVTNETWRRLLSAKEPVYGLGLWQSAADGNGRDEALAGFLHYILHPVTGYIEPACYMQDLFIAPDHRRKGYARRLVWALEEKGKNERWARIYWLAQRSDEAAQNLYKRLGITVDFTLHILPTQ